MNKDVVNEIFKRRPTRDFLRLYPSDKWKELIPDIFEIGVLNLKNSFGTLKFTKAQIKDILIDLRNYKPDEEEINLNDNNFNEKEEEDNYNNEENINDYEEEELFDNNDYNNEFHNNNNINNIQNNNLLKNNNKQNNQKEEIKEIRANAEVFIPDENNMRRKVNYNRPKIEYNTTMEEIREKNIENKRNLGYTESKIKYQIMNDKKNHQMRKRKISDDNNNNDTEGNFSFNQNKNRREKKAKNLNKNYVINFDKNLNPQKPIEMHKNRYDYNYNNVNENIINNYINQNNFNNLNEEDIFKSFNNNDDSNNNIMNNNQNIQNHLNNYKINMLNLPKYGFDRENYNEN